MKTVIYMAETLNGFVAKRNHETPWTEDEWSCFNNKVQEFGNIIIGSKTYKLMGEQLRSREFEKIQVVVVSEQDCQTNEANIVCVKSPKAALAFLRENGFIQIFVGGGPQLNSSFLNEGLVDEIYLDIEPKLFSNGISLFTDAISDTDLELIEITRTGKNSVQLHYKINK